MKQLNRRAFATHILLGTSLVVWGLTTVGFRPSSSYRQNHQRHPEYWCNECHLYDLGDNSKPLLSCVGYFPLP